jgi:hypothetical protein
MTEVPLRPAQLERMDTISTASNYFSPVGPPAEQPRLNSWGEVSRTCLGFDPEHRLDDNRDDL